jgi:predicted phage terminase large subunit-like protein
MADGSGFSEAELDILLQNVDQLSDAEAAELYELVADLAARQRTQRLRDDLIAFCCHMQGDYKVGRHHQRLARLLEDIEASRKDRICVSVPPRHGKSQLVSIYYAAWYLGRNPSHKVMLVSHTTDLAVDFGRKIRNLIATGAYREVFPDVHLAADSKSAGRWSTNHGGEFFAAGVGAALAGRGAHLLLVDDPHSEQDVLAGNFEVFRKAYEWFTFGARTRLMPGGRVAIVHTRWHMDDLIGRVVSDMTKNPGADQYEVFEFPAILDATDPETGAPVQKALWPEFFDLPELLRTKASMPAYQWNAQYQQKPTAEEAAIIKREWWRMWEREQPPTCEYIIMALDAAAEANNRADYTSITTWGVFFNEEEDSHQIILLHALKDRLEFPELKRVALQAYKDWEPDAFIVEKKSSGTALYQEMRRMGLPVQEYTPVRGTSSSPNTKMARLNSVADLISSGMVWAPDRRWAEDLVEEVAAFPYGSHDDQVDSTIMALMRFRQGGFVVLPSDETDDDDRGLPRRADYY